MKTKTIATILLASTLSFAGVAYASNHGNSKGMDNHTQCDMKKGGMKGSKGMGMMQSKFAKLDLTKAQQKKMQSIMDKQKAAKKGKKGTEADHLARRAEMQVLMANPVFDKKQAEKMLAGRQAQKNERQLAMLEAKHEMLQLLTAEQKTEFQEMQNKHHK